MGATHPHHRLTLAPLHAIAGHYTRRNGDWTYHLYTPGLNYWHL